jgi:hypothetical protein
LTDNANVLGPFGPSDAQRPVAEEFGSARASRRRPAPMARREPGQTPAGKHEHEAEHENTRCGSESKHNAFSLNQIFRRAPQDITAESSASRPLRIVVVTMAPSTAPAAIPSMLEES